MNVMCHPEQSARKEFPTRVVCGSGGRGVEGPLLPQKSQRGRLAQQQSWDCWRPKGSLDSSLRSSLGMTPQRPTACIEYNSLKGPSLMKFHPVPLRFLTFSLLLLTLCLAVPVLASDRGEGALDPSQPTGITVEKIIQNFATKEKQFT